MITGGSDKHAKLGAVVTLYDDQEHKIVLKAYASPDGKKLRIVLPELTASAQVQGDLTNHFLEFTRRLP